KENVRIDYNVFAAEVEAEYSASEPTMAFELTSTDARATAIDRSTTRRMLLAVHACFNGVFAMSQDIDGLVETSNNLASIKQQADTIRILCSQRSSSASGRADVSQTVMSAFYLAGAEVERGDGYPGWKPNPSSPILAVAVDCYKRLFGRQPKVKAIHAGLECGLFLEKYPHMDMVSFGPTLRGVHSPDERMLIPTVRMFWDHLLEVLKNVPRK
ncbi:MAG: M20/M25/M40 family metallo-hydrolase, partial [Bacteroidales bacterium]|nr:M20/M25/M40 family metallo-hydrolase [Bacteroidales bacterium]